MKTLQEHNEESLERFRKSNDIKPNGIACPECGEELVDSRPGVALLSNPPQKNVHCPKCGYTGFAYL